VPRARAEQHKREARLARNGLDDRRVRVPLEQVRHAAWRLHGTKGFAALRVRRGAARCRVRGGTRAGASRAASSRRVRLLTDGAAVLCCAACRPHPQP
jgi:hypothetical protein